MKLTKKEQFVNSIRHQLNVEITNDKDHCLNRNRNILYTQITGVYRNAVIRIMNERGMRHETHMKDYVWVWV
jgi:hypothetical protein